MNDTRLSSKTFDAIVIGSGQGGKPLSQALAKAGWRTALVERAHVGGTCINVGCTPTKTMVASARTAWLARRSAEYGVHLGPVGVTLSEVRRRKQGIVESFRKGSRQRLEATEGLDLLFGEARFTGPHTVEVRLNAGGMSVLSSERVFVNTGCRPADPGVKGLDRAWVLDSSSIMELDEIPPRLLVLGGGYVGLEFAQMFRRFGSEVVVVQRSEQLLGREDPDVAAEVAKILRDDGIDVLLDTRALEGGRASGGESAARAAQPASAPQTPITAGLWLKVATPAGERTLTSSHILAATGRAPNTEELGLDTAAVRTNERGFITVNERLETSAPGIWAMGDVTGGPAFTHISYDDFRILRTNLLAGGGAVTTGRLVPYTVYFDPQLGRVGMSETEARAKGRNVRVATLPMTSVARAIEVGETRGFMKAILDSASGEILGFAALGLEGGELMSMVEIAMLGKVPWSILKEAIFAHPTLAESLNNLFMTLDG